MKTALRLLILMLLLQACSTPEPVLPNKGQGDLFVGVKPNNFKPLNVNLTFDYAWIDGKQITPNIPVTLYIQGNVMKLTMGSHPVKSGTIKYLSYTEDMFITYKIAWTYTNSSNQQVTAGVEYETNIADIAVKITDKSGEMLLYR